MWFTRSDFNPEITNKENNSVWVQTNYTDSIVRIEPNANIKIQRVDKTTILLLVSVQKEMTKNVDRKMIFYTRTRKQCAQKLVTSNAVTGENRQKIVHVLIQVSARFVFIFVLSMPTSETSVTYG